MKKILLIGKSGRNDAIADAIARSLRPKQLYIFSDVMNASLRSKATGVRKGTSDSRDEVASYAAEVKPDFAIIGPEEPLFAGIVDLLAEMDIPSVGPTKELAQLETSKSFTRRLVSKHRIPGNPEHRIFRSIDGMDSYLRRQGSFVIKPDGLSSGKGVQVFGEHLKTIEQAIAYSRELFAAGQAAVIVEEKLDGEEFSFQSFCDGYHVIDTFPIQDHKRADEGDTGPNTGGMGSYSCENLSLPFLRQEHIDEAHYINQRVCDALRNEFHVPYKGILYGGFMVTKDGLRLIEYNARFGDPEVMNVLPLLETDFIDICEAIIAGTLDSLPISFKKKAAVCKYVVPEGYPSTPRTRVAIDLRDVPPQSDQLRVYYGAVEDDGRDGPLLLTGSRAIAMVGIGSDVAEAERIAEDAACSVRGPVMHRRDIGSEQLIRRREDHMKAVLASAPLDLPKINQTA
jgi:phosphoribosylamine--glycine ligase